MNERSIGTRKSFPGPLVIAIALLVLLLSARFLASTLLDYEWWKELHQLETWVNLLLYGTLPIAGGVLFLFLCFVAAWVKGTHRGSGRISDSRLGSRWGIVILFVVAGILANAVMDSWTVVRFAGGLRVPTMTAGYIDPIFSKPLRFYFFDLPFYELLLRIFLTGSLVSLLVYWFAAHFHDLARVLQQPRGYNLELGSLSLGGAFDSAFVRTVLAILLIALGIHFYLDRYDLLFEDHGSYLYGADYVADKVTLPLQWLMIVAAVGSAALILIRRGKLALLFLFVLPLRYFVPPIVASVYVRPNELALERPYISHHIEATRSAYRLMERVTETGLNAKPFISIDYQKHKPLLENVRLWDWRAFHDTVSQIQPLRPYAYFDTDVDRYQINGSLQQVLLTPRELDIQQLGDARNRWVNPHLIYTHGYGIVMAGANRITSDGLPQLWIEGAPPRVNVPNLNLKEPALYYGEIDQEPVYVATAQPEFDYPSGGENVHTHYAGTGGIPISSLILRTAAAVRYGDPNVLLTNYLKAGSRVMFHRRVVERLSTLAGFLHWESDPYLVLNSQGRLIWICDGYMSSALHPYSRELEIQGLGVASYIRNSVKATVDAYSGETHLYVFDQDDLLIQAYRHLFPRLLEAASNMPSDLRAHARYPETLFAVQAEIYRAFHMRDPEAFYNRADLWDVARTSTAGANETASIRPTYVVAALPGETNPEFLLMIPFTPANKDNLIGMMYAKCDGDKLGDLVFQQLGKQNIIYGPKQIEAFINQDQTISKDLTLWNQQGSEVLRGQVLVLPIENSFLYVQPIYIQASGARMPQLKKVALAMGDHLAYADTYQQALNQLLGQGTEQPSSQEAVPAASPTQPAPQDKLPSAVTQQNQELLRQLREHFDRYRQLSSQGKYSEAGKELETIQNLLSK
jgi:uncharacterized membrane protein (UPF0182 family)